MKKLAIFISEYTIDISPSIVNLLNLLADNYYIDLYLQAVYYRKSKILNNSNINVIDILPDNCTVLNQNYHNYICIDPHGFYLCKELFPECSPIYYSFELYIKKNYCGLSYPANIMNKERKEINQIKGLIIQSEEREQLFRSDYNLNSTIPSLILPVTYQGPSIAEKNSFLQEKYCIDQNKKIAIHLGGIAEWFSCIEIASIFSKLSDWILFFQGYPDKNYLEKFNTFLVKKNIKNVIISQDRYFEIDDLYKIITSCDLGIAWYNDLSLNMSTAGKSSGKIAAYLQCGLPVIAKKYKSTLEVIQNTESGFCVDNYDEIPEAIRKIEKNYNKYSQNATLEYEKNYKFENYKEKILKFIEL